MTATTFAAHHSLCAIGIVPKLEVPLVYPKRVPQFSESPFSNLQDLSGQMPLAMGNRTLCRRWCLERNCVHQAAGGHVALASASETKRRCVLHLQVLVSLCKQRQSNAVQSAHRLIRATGHNHMLQELKRGRESCVCSTYSILKHHRTHRNPGALGHSDGFDSCMDPADVATSSTSSPQASPETLNPKP